MLIKKPDTIKSSEITSESVYQQRRLFMKGVAATLAVSPLSALAAYELESEAPRYLGPDWMRSALNDAKKNAAFSTQEKLAPYSNIITHNNFYEFGLSKQDPSRRAQGFKTDPWSVAIEGEAAKTGVFALEDLLSPYQMEERIYRLRCVEAWSMVIPWIGIPLADMLKRFEPNSKAKYVEFTTLYAPEQMPGQKGVFSTLDWPYVEALRIDEAMSPLAFMATGLYGQAMPPQNGAPFRLVVPWKYGFKSIKSIVKIRFTEKMPITTWNSSAPKEYGFYANVNPSVDHPRWTQKTERRLPSSLFPPNIIDTQPFNGYGDEVAHLYSGMDLRKWF